MRWTKRLNYVLIFLAMAVSIGKAQENNYEEEMRKFMDIYGKSNVYDEAKAANLPYFIDFLNRYSDRIPAELKVYFKDLKSSLMISDDNTEVLVDGMPIQGGAWGSGFRSGLRQGTRNGVVEFFDRVMNWIFSFMELLISSNT